MPTKAPPPIAPLYNWTGFYTGLNLGGSCGHQDNALLDPSELTFLSNSDHIDGVVVGGQIGYNWRANQWVFDLEADFQGSGGEWDILCPGYCSVSGRRRSSQRHQHRLR